MAVRAGQDELVLSRGNRCAMMGYEQRTGGMYVDE